MRRLPGAICVLDDPLMGRGRNGKSCVLRDNARERRIRDEAATHLDLAANVIQQWFTSEGDTISRLDHLSGLIRDGQVDYTDQVRT